MSSITHQKVADYYSKALSNIIQTPVLKHNRTSAWAQYTVRLNNRDYIQNELKKKDIPTAVFYPLPLHLQECFRYLNYNKGNFPICEKASKEVISLPMNAFLKLDQIDWVASNIKEHI